MSELVKLHQKLKKDKLPALATEVDPNPFVLGTTLRKDEIVHSPKISELTKDIVIASLYPRINVAPKNESGERLKEVINLTIAESGFRNEIEDIKFLILKVIDDIFRDYSHFTCKEVELAFRKGIRGTLGDGKMFGLSVRQMNIWLETYDKELKRNAFMELKNHDKPKEEKLPKEEVDRLWLDRVFRSYAKFEKDDIFDFNDFNNKFYDLCWRQWVFRLPKEAKNNYFELAKTAYLEEKNPKNGNGAEEKKRFARIMKNVADGEKNETEIIRNKAKKLAVEYIFKQFKKHKVDIVKSITEAFQKDEQEYKELVEKAITEANEKREKEQQDKES